MSIKVCFIWMPIYLISDIVILQTPLYYIISYTCTLINYIEFYSFYIIFELMVIATLSMTYSPLHWKVGVALILNFFSLDVTKIALFYDPQVSISYELLEGLLKQHPVYLYLQIVFTYINAFFEFFSIFNLAQSGPASFILGWCFSIGMLWGKYNDNWGLFWSSDFIEIILLFFTLLSVIESHEFVEEETPPYKFLCFLILLYLLIGTRVGLIPTKHVFFDNFENKIHKTMYVTYNNINLRNIFFNILFVLGYCLLYWNNCLDKFIKYDSSELVGFICLLFINLFFYLIFFKYPTLSKYIYIVFLIISYFSFLLLIGLCISYIKDEFNNIITDVTVLHTVVILSFFYTNLLDWVVLNYSIRYSFISLFCIHSSFSYNYHETSDSLEFLGDILKRIYMPFESNYSIFIDFCTTLNIVLESKLEFKYIIFDGFFINFEETFIIDYLNFDLIFNTTKYSNYLLHEIISVSV